MSIIAKSYHNSSDKLLMANIFGQFNTVKFLIQS